MSALTRRDLLKLTGAAAGLAAAGAVSPLRARGRAHVVVIGGGFGGATCAKYLRRLDPSLRVTLIEQHQVYFTCPFSNAVLGGLLDMDAIAQAYGGLKAHGVELVQDVVSALDPAERKLRLAGGNTLSYDRAVVAPGISLRFDAVEGYDEAAASVMPHAWKAGPQTELLRRQLKAMPDGGTVIIAAPGNPYRCPPGPYERASLIAHYLKRHKPKAKILILDAKESFAKQALFMQGWQKLYPGAIEWVPGTEGGIVESVDPKNRTLVTEAGFTKHRGDVVNFIPPQAAAALAQQADLVDETGWCPIDQGTFESTRQPGVHVIGDAAVAGEMPKSAFCANDQAKVCAAAVQAALAERELAEPSYANTCYSLLAPDYGISVSEVFRLSQGVIAKIEGAGGVSPSDVGAEFRAHEADYARGWYASITADTFGKI